MTVKTPRESGLLQQIEKKAFWVEAYDCYVFKQSDLVTQILNLKTEIEKLEDYVHNEMGKNTVIAISKKKVLTLIDSGKDGSLKGGGKHGSITSSASTSAPKDEGGKE